MRVTEYDADDTDSIEVGRSILDAARAIDAPWIPELTAHRRAMQVRYGYDRSPERHFLAWADGVPVGVAQLELPEWDNQDLAWFYLTIHPAHRRRGHGSELLAHLTRVSQEAGRTKIGGSGFEAAATEAFARRHGYTLGQVEVPRVLHLDNLPPGMAKAAYAQAEPLADAYELIRTAGRTPPELLPAVAELTASINDAPLDDLEVEDEYYPAERINDYETATLESGFRLYRLLARHRESGELAGHTIVTVDAESPQLAHQDDTSVVRAHRGHRLGLLLKAGMMLWLAEAEPQIATIDTGNAESNDHMIQVNDRLGYRATGRELSFQRRV